MQLRPSGGSLAVGVAIWLIAVAAGLAALSAAAARPGLERAHPALSPSAHAALDHPRKLSGVRRRASADALPSPGPLDALHGEFDAARRALEELRSEAGR